MSAEIDLVVEDLATYVGIASPSGHEGPLAAVIFNQLKAFKPARLEMVGSGVGAIFDGESTDGSLLVIACHIDTVDLDIMNPTFHQENILGGDTWYFGPGSGDDKAGAALMTNIGRRSANKRLPGRTALIYLGNEEVNDDDVPLFAYWMSGEYEPGRIGCVNLEPTSNKLYTGQLGGVTIPVKTYGAIGHPALSYSDSGTALSWLAKYMGSLDEVENTWKEYKDWTGVPTLIPLEIKAGGKGQITHSAEGVIRISSTEKLANVWDIARLELEHSGIILGEIDSNYLHPSKCSKESLIYQAVEQVLPSASIARGLYPLYTHQKPLNDLGIPTLIKGPGYLNRRTLHTKHDAVRKSDLISCNNDLRQISQVFPTIAKKN